MIYVVIVALWAALLIPMWLRRHDRSSEDRSTKRFISAMASLSSDAHPVVRNSPAHRAATSGAHPLSRESLDRDAQFDARDLQPNAARNAARSRAARRRMVVMSFLGLLAAVTLGLSLASIVPIIVPITAAALAVMFIIAGAATASSRTTPTVSSRENVRRDGEGVVLKPGPAPRTPRSRVDEEDERLATPPTQIDRARELRRREALDDYSEPRRAVGQ